MNLLCFQSVLRELEQKKPQLDELVHTAENLKADSNRQQLHGKGNLKLFDDRITAPNLYLPFLKYPHLTVNILRYEKSNRYTFQK